MADEGVPVDLVEDGVLWLINRVVFHPRGFALAWHPETKEFTLEGNGSEPWVFPPGSDDDKFLAVEELLERVRKES